jgi:hypothetical protein
MDEFAGGLQYPTVIVGPDEPESFPLNQRAFGMLELLRLVPHQSGSDKPNKVKWERPSVYSPEGTCGHNLSDAVLAQVAWKLCNPLWLIAE